MRVASTRGSQVLPVAIDPGVPAGIAQLDFSADGAGAAALIDAYAVVTDSGSFTVDQTGLVDAATNMLYFFIVGCESQCFAQNRRTISEVADSWTIKER